MELNESTKLTMKGLTSYKTNLVKVSNSVDAHLLTLSTHAREAYSSHFVCRSVVQHGISKTADFYLLIRYCLEVRKPKVKSV